MSLTSFGTLSQVASIHLGESIFTTVSGYTNTGLTLLNQSFIPLADQYAVLVLAGVGVLAGNAFYPVFLRLAVWAVWKAVPRQSQLHHTCTFLLHHPGRCYLFPLPILEHLGFVLRPDRHYSAIMDTLDSPAARLRTGHSPLPHRVKESWTGYSSPWVFVPQASTSSSSTTLPPPFKSSTSSSLYISVFPILLSIRSSNIYEERSLGQPSSASRPDHNSGSKNSYGGLSQHIRHQLVLRHLVAAPLCFPSPLLNVAL